MRQTPTVFPSARRPPRSSSCPFARPRLNPILSLTSTTSTLARPLALPCTTLSVLSKSHTLLLPGLLPQRTFSPRSTLARPIGVTCMRHAWLQLFCKVQTAYQLTAFEMQQGMERKCEVCSRDLLSSWQGMRHALRQTALAEPPRPKLLPCTACMQGHAWTGFKI